jgi:hypothetical protein
LGADSRRQTPSFGGGGRAARSLGCWVALGPSGSWKRGQAGDAGLAVRRSTVRYKLCGVDRDRTGARELGCVAVSLGRGQHRAEGSGARVHPRRRASSPWLTASPVKGGISYKLGAATICRVDPKGEFIRVQVGEAAELAASPELRGPAKRVAHRASGTCGDRQRLR